MQWACKVRGCTCLPCLVGCGLRFGRALWVVRCLLVVCADTAALPHVRIQSIVMRQFIDNEGKHVPPTHEAKLRKARRRGGRAGMWAAVETYNSISHAPAQQNN